METSREERLSAQRRRTTSESPSFFSPLSFLSEKRRRTPGAHPYCTPSQVSLAAHSFGAPPGGLAVWCSTGAVGRAGVCLSAQRRRRRGPTAAFFSASIGVEPAPRRPTPKRPPPPAAPIARPPMPRFSMPWSGRQGGRAQDCRPQAPIRRKPWTGARARARSPLALALAPTPQRAHSLSSPSPHRHTHRRPPAFPRHAHRPPPLPADHPLHPRPPRPGDRLGWRRRGPVGKPGGPAPGRRPPRPGRPGRESPAGPAVRGGGWGGGERGGG